MQREGLSFGSLFSGIGGFDLGLERAGHRCLWQVEIDPKCRELLAQKWPGVERHDDVRTVGAGLAPVDLICGGFPCQDLSVAGRRAGLAGERSGLWHEFHRVLALARPQWCVIENVPGLLSSNGGRDFTVLLRGLVELGYGVCWRILDSQFTGLAQRRDRVFVVGSLGDGRAAQVLFEPESVRWNPAPRRATGEGTAPVLAARTGSGGAGTDAECDGAVVASPVRASDGHHGWSGGRGDGHDNVVPTLRVGGREQGAGSSYDNTPLIQVADPILANLARTNGGAGNNPRPRNLLPAVAWALQERDGKGPDSDTKDGHLIAVQEAQTGVRLYAESGALRANGPGHDPVGTRIMGAAGVRRLTPRECERLQGFPDDWTAGFSDSVRYRMLGNAVSVPVALAIGRRLL